MTKAIYLRGAAVAVVAAMTVSTPVCAQDDEGAGEIIVTAQKRETKLEKTPVTISVIDSTEISSRGGAVELRAIAANVPSLKINDGVAGLVSVALRGVGTASSNQMFEQSIGLFVDGVYNPKPIQYRSGLLDVERVEVIKGGQGVLFGESTSVGGISIITKKPTDRTGGYLSAMYEPRYNSWDATGVANLALSNDLSLRVAGNYNRSRGYVKNVNLNNFGPDERRWIGRATLQWEPSSTFSATLKFEASSVDTRGDGYQFRDFFVPPAVQAVFGYETISSTPYFTSQGFAACGTTCVQYLSPVPLDYARSFPAPGTDIRAQNATLTLAKEFDSGITLTSVTGWQHFTYENLFDSDLTPAPILYQGIDQKFKQVSQEIRLASANSSTLNWMVGISALDQHDDFVYTLDAQNLFIPGLGLLNGTGTNILLSHSQGIAGFGQLTYPLTDTISVTGGARVSRKSRDGQFSRITDNLGDPTNGINFFSPPGPDQSPRIREDALDLSASLNYQITPSLLLYAAFSKGRKMGAFNNGFIPGLPGPVPLAVRPQTTHSYESGFKWRSADGRLYLSAAGYYLDITDFQDSFFDATTLSFVVGNKDARSKGFEIESRARLADWLSLNASYNYTDAKFKSGEPMQRAPKHSLAAGAYLSTPVSPLSGELFFAPSMNYSSSFLNQSPTAAGNNRSNGRTNIDLRMGIEFDNGIEVSVLGENLTNSRDIVMSFGNPLGLGTEGLYNRPRTFSFGVKVPFGQQ